MMDVSKNAPDNEELFTLLYTRLKQKAQGQLRHLPPGQTFQATALVHEAYARLMSQEHRQWESHSQFFAIAVRAMRDVLVEAVRRRCAAKRGGDLVRVTLTDGQESLTLGAEDFSSLTDALGKLEQEDPELAHMVLLRFFGGFSMMEISKIQDVPMRTLERRWRYTRAWLQAELHSE